MSKFEDELNEFLDWIDEYSEEVFRKDLAGLLHTIGNRIVTEVSIQSRGEESGKYEAIEKLREIEREIWHE